VLRIDIPVLQKTPPPTPAAAPPAATAAPASPVAPSPTSAPADSGGGSRRKVFALSLAGLGLAGVGVGTVFGLKMSSADEDARAICKDPQTPCSLEEVLRHEKLKEEAHDARTFFYVGVGAGGAALIAGAVLLLTAPKSESTQTATIAPGASFGPGFANVEMRGAW
jgi:hypothetical protein